MTTPIPVKHRLKPVAILIASLIVGACVYRIDIQQGNVLEPEAVEQVEIGMTRSQVQFLLGTPMVADAFHEERWDYAYYLRRGRSRDIDRRWIVVYFEEDRVVRLDRDLILDPT
ncbi:outer membrane protein assembly factor BamE [Candidatus Rariloculus sp.]|uniref:outer membrane protein assembly factor BamE n=1 Tax=Candidatus Rariloculus sp. TaxID=3101265 RepID=UPI003D1354B7